MFFTWVGCWPAMISGISAAPVANTWIRVASAMSGTTYRVFVTGVQISSVSELTDLTSGNVVLEKLVVPTGAAVWFDDVVARRYVIPEPGVALGAEQPAP